MLFLAILCWCVVLPVCLTYLFWVFIGEHIYHWILVKFFPVDFVDQYFEDRRKRGYK